jgi:hypothetical protein
MRDEGASRDLVAEQVEKVNPDLVAPDEKGKAYTVRYEAVNAMVCGWLSLAATTTRATSTSKRSIRFLCAATT